MLKVDLHLHTKEDNYDNLDYSAKELIDRAVELKFDVLAITLHNEIFFSKDLISYAEQKGILLIPGVELSIEKKHVLLYNVSEDELKELIFQIREFENCLGTAEISLSKADWVYRRRIKKFIVAKKDLKAGDVLTLSDLDYKRTQKEGFLPDEFNQLIGKKVAQDIKKDSLIDNNA